MKNQILKYSLLSIALIGVTSVASAHVIKVGTDLDVNTKTETKVIKSETNTSATTSTKAEFSNSGTSTDHMNAVIDLVLRLNSVADKDNGVGVEVRAVAKEQASTSERVSKNIEKVEMRGAVKTFLVGSDYKTLGELRSDMKVTENSISRLTKAKEKAVDASVKSELETQIKVLEKEEVKIDTFIEAKKGKASLFGWLVKLFVKVD
ncbi:MAG TPA: hypothetical protein VGC58_02360 [Candidatus Paceibacterota bacterium]